MVPIAGCAEWYRHLCEEPQEEKIPEVSISVNKSMTNK
jgi:hypothetical protein